MGSMRVLSGLFIAFLALYASPLAAEDKELPFPVSKSTILREGGVVYIVEGRLEIPKGVEISCQKDVYIRGRGSNPTIFVVGALKVHGVGAREVIFENVTVELAKEFLDVQLDMVIFRKGGGVRTSKEPASGKLFLENLDLQDDAAIDVDFRGGSIDLSSVSSGSRTSITAVNVEGERNKIKLKIRGSNLTGLSVKNVADVTVRLTRIAGDSADFEDCDILIFDGNKVNATILDIRHRVAGGLKKTKITKCDIYSDEVRVRAPLKKGRSVDQIVIDRCWFNWEEDPRVVRKNVIRDAEDDETNGARVKLGKVMKRANELAGAVDR